MIFDLFLVHQRWHVVLSPGTAKIRIDCQKNEGVIDIFWGLMMVAKVASGGVAMEVSKKYWC